MLVVMEHRNVHFFLKALFNNETFGRLDIFKVDPAKGGAHQAHSLAKGVWVFGVQFDVDGVHICEAFEKDRFAFHYGL